MLRYIALLLTTIIFFIGCNSNQNLMGKNRMPPKHDKKKSKLITIKKPYLTLTWEKRFNKNYRNGYYYAYFLNGKIVDEKKANLAKLRKLLNYMPDGMILLIYPIPLDSKAKNVNPTDSIPFSDDGKILNEFGRIWDEKKFLICFGPNINDIVNLKTICGVKGLKKNEMIKELYSREVVQEAEVSGKAKK